ncbi:MAG: MBL fold metallo-hydrolase [Clostridiales bacterium]|nr:MBL fold metallo-hydrolase [Clostridiales bacterium]
MVEFKTEKITNRITRIFGLCTELMYLIEGDRYAALLDTGSGFGSLKACVDKLTDKPILVLLTHGHVDHAMGTKEFDTIYMNRKDDYIFVPHGADSFRQADFNELSLPPEDYIPTDDYTRFQDVKGGDSFDLGGIHIDIYDCVGHTYGSVAMLIREERMLLTGDGCNPFSFMFEDYSTPITAYRDSLMKLKAETDGKYDAILLSHGDGNGPTSIIPSVIAVCDDILAGTTDDVPFSFKGHNGFIAKAMNPETMSRMDGVVGNIVYNKNNI